MRRLKIGLTVLIGFIKFGNENHDENVVASHAIRQKGMVDRYLCVKTASRYLPRLLAIVVHT